MSHIGAFLNRDCYRGSATLRKVMDQDLELLHNIKEFSTLLQESLACFNLIMYPPKYSIYTKVYSSHPHITKGKMTEKKCRRR